MVLNCRRKRDLKRACKFKVKLNGVITDAFYADPRRGVIRQYVRDEKGLITCESFDYTKSRYELHDEEDISRARIFTSVS